VTTPAAQLGGISLAEHEYAWRFRDHLEVGDTKPGAAGFDATRIEIIERALRDKFYAQREKLRRRT
jgi:hypothetical protein